MMRKLYIFVLVCFLAASCAQDEGNYIYRELEEPVITGIGDMAVLSSKLGREVTIDELE